MSNNIKTNQYYLAFVKKNPDDFSSFMWLVNKIYVFIEGGFFWRGWSYLYEQPLAHVEFITEDYFTYGINEGTYDNAGKYKDGKVHKVKHKTFANRNYEVILEFTVLHTKYKKCIKFLEDCFMSGDTFDHKYKSTFLFFIGQFIKKEENTWFCSELITAALQEAGLMDKNINPRTVTPQLLYEWSLQNGGTLTQKIDLIKQDDDDFSYYSA